MNLTAEKIKRLALSLGFHEVGITSLASLSEGEKAIESWVKEGRHGSMKYLEDFQGRKERLLQEIPDAKSVIVLGINYFTAPSRHPERSEGSQILRAFGPQDDGLRGRVARYAWGKDYHHVIRRKHEELIKRLRVIPAEAGIHRTMDSRFRGNDKVRFKSCIDTQPLPERFAAQRAGLGFVGKNTMLLSRRFGPWLFLSEIVTNLDLQEDLMDQGNCGSCNHCQTQCPTGALDQDYRIDARKCIAYLTIEHRGVIEKELRPKVKDWIFGCDECLNVCPFTSKSKLSDWEEFQPEKGAGPFLSLGDLFQIKSNKDYEKTFKGTPLLRASRKQMLRNACLVLANSSRPAAIPFLEIALQDPSSLVRVHAAWALGQFEQESARSLLKSRLRLEKDSQVVQEIAEALD